MLALVALAASAIGYTALAAGQSVETETTCGGRLALDRSQPLSENQLTYKLSCSAEVTAYTLVSTKRVDGFAPEIDSFGRDGKPGDFRCVGDIPSDGFRCFGKKLNAKLIAGTFNTEETPCKKPRLRVWAVATGPKGDNSRPRRLAGPKCPKPRAKHKRKRR
jgi:hypothetical protein